MRAHCLPGVQLRVRASATRRGGASRPRGRRSGGRRARPRRPASSPRRAARSTRLFHEETTRKEFLQPVFARWFKLAISEFSCRATQDQDAPGTNMMTPQPDDLSTDCACVPPEGEGTQEQKKLMAPRPDDFSTACVCVRRCGSACAGACTEAGTATKAKGC